MSYFSAFSAFVSAHRASRAQARARLYFSELPFDIRKDIGWPEADVFAEQVRVSRAARATELPH